jgi:retron-type reverse transcriptase
LALAIGRKKVNWMLDEDLKGFFDSIAHDDFIACVDVGLLTNANCG